LNLEALHSPASVTRCFLHSLNDTLYQRKLVQIKPSYRGRLAGLLNNDCGDFAVCMVPGNSLDELLFQRPSQPIA